MENSRILSEPTHRKRDIADPEQGGIKPCTADDLTLTGGKNSTQIDKSEVSGPSADGRVSIRM